MFIVEKSIPFSAVFAKRERPVPEKNPGPVDSKLLRRLPERWQTK